MISTIYNTNNIINNKPIHNFLNFNKYTTIFLIFQIFLWERQGSNLWPQNYEFFALTNWATFPKENKQVWSHLPILVNEKHLSLFVALSL